MQKGSPTPRKQHRVLEETNRWKRSAGWVEYSEIEKVWLESPSCVGMPSREASRDEPFVGRFSPSKLNRSAHTSGERRIELVEEQT